MAIKEIEIYQEAEKCYPQRWPVDLENTYKRDGFIEGAKWLLSQLPKWIPVSEQLPEEDGRYLCIVHDYERHEVINFLDGHFLWDDVDARIEYWRPLPADNE